MYSFFQILFKCAVVIFSTNLEDVLQNVEDLIVRLEKFYFEDTKITEGRKAQVIQRMSNALVKKSSRNKVSIWSIKHAISQY